MVWQKGDKLQGGRYVIEKVLGEGGFGITYQAQHTLLKQWVVIKTPNERLQNHPEYPKFVKRFIEEGRKLAKLSEQQHPNIVRISDLFQEGNLYCLIMDFVAGESLLNLVEKRGALSAAEAVGYIQQIGEALIVVHQAGLVHRDAHPGNIMIQKNGKAILIDFGIAADIQGHYTSMHPANIAFAPYEQMRGHKKPAVDIYTLAASLYYTVTARYPESSFDRKLHDTPLIPPRKYVSISDDLNKAILKGMELESQNRPQSMDEWLNLLGNIPLVKNHNVQKTSQTIPLPVQKINTFPYKALLILGITYLFIGFMYAFSPLLMTITVVFLSFTSAYSVISDQQNNFGLIAVVCLFILCFSLMFTNYYVICDVSTSWTPCEPHLGHYPAEAIMGAFAPGVTLICCQIFRDNTHQLLKKWQIFLILSLTSSSGLFLGWLVYQFFPIFANR